jgi:hypothetical protein
MAETKSNYALSNEDLQKFQESGIVGPFRLLADHEVESVLRKFSIAKAKLFFWRRIFSRSWFLKEFSSTKDGVKRSGLRVCTWYRR